MIKRNVSFLGQITAKPQTKKEKKLREWGERFCNRIRVEKMGEKIS